MKKRLFAVLLAATLVIGLGACGSSDKDKEPSSGTDTNIEQGTDENETGSDVVTDAGVAVPDPGTTPGGTNTETAGGSETAGKPGTSKPSTPKPDAVKPGATKPDAVKPGATKPGNTKPDATKPAISGTFEEIIDSIYTKVGYDVKTANTEVTAENAEFYLGVSDISYKKALASEPMMSSVAHSVVLIEAEKGADIKSMEKKIKENVNGRKWVCVGVEPENILVDHVGNYILLVMDEDAQSFMDAFLAMGK